MLDDMPIDCSTLPEPVQAIVAKRGALTLPLTRTGECDRAAAAAVRNAELASLFPSARDGNAALSGLLLLLGCWEESHVVSQDNASSEGSYWHGIAHRIEPDSSNAAYWFRQTGAHPIFPQLYQKASGILERNGETGWRLQRSWDPFLFITWCDQARAERGAKEQTAVAIQEAEWRLLFDWCAG